MQNHLLKNNKIGIWFLSAYINQFDQKNVGGDLIEEKDLFFGLKIHLQESMMKFQVPHRTACSYYYYINVYNTPYTLF